MKINHGSGRDHRLRYEAVFLDVDNTLPWVRVDAEGRVVDLSPYDTTGSLTAETATGLAWETLRRSIREHLKHRTKDDLAHFERRNIERTTSGSRLADRASTLISECEAAIARATAYSREHFEDP
ncbi:MAG: hypothetical protein ICV58_08785, partial [Rubrobacteraceae bacterium]|nr:hypothetical protein [Rubrobacteraceae bacterium]